MIINNQKVRFCFYRDGNLGTRPRRFRFAVPIAEAGTATFATEDRAMLVPSGRARASHSGVANVVEHTKPITVGPLTAVRAS